MSRAAKVAVDWSRIATSYGLGRETTTALNAFRKRASEASLLNAQLSDLASTSSIDFAHYRSVLKNQQIVDEVEKAVKGFKPVTIDPAKEIKAIEAFEVKAVSAAEETTSKIKDELVDLKAALVNIQQSRPIEDLLVDDVVKAIPEVEEAVEVMVSKGKFEVPGFKEKFGNWNML